MPLEVYYPMIVTHLAVTNLPDAVTRGLEKTYTIVDNISRSYLNIINSDFNVLNEIHAHMVQLRDYIVRFAEISVSIDPNFPSSQDTVIARYRNLKTIIYSVQLILDRLQLIINYYHNSNEVAQNIPQNINQFREIFQQDHAKLLSGLKLLVTAIRILEPGVIQSGSNIDLLAPQSWENS